MRIAVFGTGACYRYKKEVLNNFEIVVMFDNAKEKQGSYIDGVYVDKPENVSNYAVDFIFLVSDYYREMRTQLLELGVPDRKIIDKEHLGLFGEWNICKRKEYREEKVFCKESKAKVMLYSHDMSLTGAPLVLFDMACVLKEEGYEVDVFTPREGNLIYDYLNKGISVTVLQSSQEEFPIDVEEVKRKYDLVVACTFCCHSVVKKLNDTGIPVVWWIHEAEDVYTIYAEDFDKDTVGENVHVYGGGSKAIEVFKNYTGQENVKELLYGVENRNVEISCQEKEKRVFAVVASVHQRKGQHIFVKAIENNWKEWKDKAEFWIIGDMTDKQREDLEGLNFVKLFKHMDREHLKEIYRDIDVIVCPSLRDPMPVVLVEGMVQKKVCIVSDATGTAQFIEPYVNGLLCHAGDVESLAEMIQWVLDNPEKIGSVGEKGHEIYLNHFAMERFRQNVLRVMEDCV